MNDQKSLPLSRYLCAILAVCVFAAPALAQTSGSSPQQRNSSAAARVTLKGNTPPLALTANDGGAAPDSLPMERMLMVLQRSPERESVLQTLLQEQQTKGSASYHRWLSPQEFGAQFGPAEENVNQAVGWLTAQGFRVNRVSAGRNVIEFNGTAGLVRKAFATEIHKYTVQGKPYWANNSDPQIPAGLASVVHGLVSLNNFPSKSEQRTAEALSAKGTPQTGGPSPQFTYPQPGCASSGNCYGVTPADFATIYDVTPLWNAGIDGTGQSIVIPAGSNIKLQDVRNFRQLFNLPANDPVVTLAGSDPGLVQVVEFETNLAVQWAGAVAKNATIQLVVAQTTASTRGIDLAALYAVENNMAPVLTESLSICEDDLGVDGTNFYSVLWEQAAAQGMTVVIPTGDTGSAACDSPTTEIAATHGLAVNGVASTAYNVAVGGTDFSQVGNWSQYWSNTNDPTTYASVLSYIPETTWNDTCSENGFHGCDTVSPSGSDLVAGGSGLSKYTQQPPWQMVGSFNSALQGTRGIPDVSMFSSDGNNGSFYIICELDAQAGGPGCDLNPPYQDFVGLGGTTGAAATFAGIMALVNQQTNDRQGNANFVLYPLANKFNDATVFHDVSLPSSTSVACVAGTPLCSNTSDTGYGFLGDATVSYWSAYPGFDSATGWGSVDANNLVTQWASVNFLPTTTTLVSLTPTNSTHGEAVTFQVNVTANGGGTPTGDVALIVHPSSGPTYALDVFALQNGSFSGSTTHLPGGTYQITAHYPGDGTYGVSDSSPVTVNVGSQPSQTVMSVPVNESNGTLNCQTDSLELPYGSSYALRADVNLTGVPCTGVNTISFPTGTITLTDNGTPIDGGTFTLNSRGHIEDDAASLTPGFHNIVATYSGDNSYQPSTSAPLSLLIDSGSTRLSLTANPTTVVSGQNVTISAVLNTSSIAAQPTGSIQFRDAQGNFLGSAPLTGATGPGGYVLATANFVFAPANSVQVTGFYNGDSNYSGTQSQPVSIASGTPDFLAVGAPNPLVVTAGINGTSTISVTTVLGYTGTVAFACPATLPPGVTCGVNPGTVTLTSQNGQTPATTVVTVGTQGPSSLSPQSASRRGLVALPVRGSGTSAGVAFGILMVALVFALRRRPKVAMAFSTAGIVLFTIGCSAFVNPANSKASSLTLLTTNPKTAQGTNLTVTAAISAGHTVSGTVTFFDNGTQLAPPATVNDGRASITLNTLVVGTHSLTASYSGDSSTEASQSNGPFYQVITGDFPLAISATSGTLSHPLRLNVTLQ